MQPMGKRKDDDMEGQRGRLSTQHSACAVLKPAHNRARLTAHACCFLLCPLLSSLLSFTEEVSPFADLRKNVVLREARIFNDRELNPAECAQVLTKLLYLISQGEHLSSDEATEVFFAVTKLFQSPDPHLRRLIYLMIKELKVESDSSLIVVSCLTGDHRVLTRRGWRLLSKATATDEVLSLNKDTYVMEWKRVRQVVAHPVDPTKKEHALYRLEGSGMDVVATSNHNMLLAKLDGRSATGLQAKEPVAYETVEELLPAAHSQADNPNKRKGGGRLTYASSSTSENSRFLHCQKRAVVCASINSQPDIKRVFDWWWAGDRQLGFLRFIGFWLRHGHLATQNGLVAIGQKKVEGVKWLERLLGAVFPRWWYRNVGNEDDTGTAFTYYIRCPPLYNYLRVMAIGPAGYNPRDPQELRSYPHFTVDAGLAAEERKSGYYTANSSGAGRGTRWRQEDMLAAFNAVEEDETAWTPSPVEDDEEEWTASPEEDEKKDAAAAPPVFNADDAPLEVQVVDEEGEAELVPLAEAVEDEKADEALGQSLQAAGAIVWWNNGWRIIINGHWFYLKRWLGDEQQIVDVYSRLSQQQAIALLEGFCRADGTWSDIDFEDGRPTGVWRCSNSSFPLIDHISLIAQLAGAAVDLALHTTAGKAITINGRTVAFSVDHWQLSCSFTKSERGLPFQTAPLAQPVPVSGDDVAQCGYHDYKYDGQVYCVEVEGNSNFLTHRLSVERVQSKNRTHNVKAHSIFIGNCLSKDMSSKFDLFRANSIRVLASIMDASMVGQMERFLKQAIVDKNPFIMASALSAGQQLYGTSPEVVKRWLNEITEALTNKSKMVQYHALALLYRIRAADKLALSKVVTSLARHNPSIAGSPMAQVLHIRIITSLLLTTQSVQQASAAGAIHAELLKYVTDCLHAKHYVVMYEAARALVRLDHLLTAQQLVPAISVIQEMLTSTISAHRFAAVRTLSEVVVRYPLLVNPCVTDLEHCINDPNRSIATLAITTLLKTGVESNVDRLMKSISGFMADISDEFKVVLVDAIRSLCLKFPHKFPALINFLASALREEGGYKYKKAIVDAMLAMIADIKEAQELGLECFCEFIEDCEFPELSVRILHVLGERGPLTANPAKYIRFIFNRVILETASVRSAAVSSLAKFGSNVPSLTENIIVLLQRCLTDNDDEVRERAVYYINILSKDIAMARSCINQRPPAPLYQLEGSLLAYLARAHVNQPFSLQKDLIAVGPDPDLMDESGKPGAASAAPSTHTSPSLAPSAAGATPSAQLGGEPVNPGLELLRSIPELAALGPVFKSCAPASLTEAESEYVVVCVKHILQRHVVFQFNVTNNMEQQQLDGVSVEMECDTDGWAEELSIPEATLQYGIAGMTFVVWKRSDESYTSGGMTCTLHFKVREVDDGEVIGEEGDGVADEYQLEEIEVVESDFMRAGSNIALVEFKRQWEELGESVELVKKYSLGLDNLQAAVTAVLELLGMQACESSGVVVEGARTHAVNLTGQWFGGVNVLARAGFGLDARHGVTLKIAVRSPNARVNQMLTNAIR